LTIYINIRRHESPKAHKLDSIERKNSRKSPVGSSGQAKNSRRKNKNGLNKIKEEKVSSGGPDPGGGHMSVGGHDMGDGGSSGPTPSKGLSDDMLLNGGDIKLENPSTPQIMDPTHECPSDLQPLHDLGHPDFPDCKF